MLDKSALNNKLINGVIISATKLFIIALKAVPITKPTAQSKAFPLDIKALNS